MKQHVLSRYERDTEANIIIDVAADRVEDLYNNFDKNAPYTRRDLDQDLADYLIECGHELGRIPFTIRFSLASSPDELKSSRIRNSLSTYFLYLADRETRKILQMFRRSAILLAIGLAILFASVSVNQMLGPERSVTANVFAEGLTVAAWVSLWEALAVFMVELSPLRKNVLLYRRLAQAKIILRSSAAAEPNIGE